MSEGFPDYARLSLAGGFQLFAHTGIVLQNAILFEGYVGPWPYVNMFCDPHLGAANLTITLEWYSDSTFTTLVGFRLAPRNQFSISATQYANLSPWLKVFYESQGGVNVNFDLFGLYATTGVASGTELLSSDAPLFSDVDNVVAGGTDTFNIQHIQVGDATMNITSFITSWFVEVDYLSANTYVWTLLGRFDSQWAGNGGTWSLPMIDAPHQLVIHNKSSAAQNIYVGWIPRL